MIKHVVVLQISTMSFENIQYSIGPNIEPCGMLNLNWKESEWTELTFLVRLVRPFKYELNHDRADIYSTSTQVI